jgi:hypothetical protein
MAIAAQENIFLNMAYVRRKTVTQAKEFTFGQANKSKNNRDFQLSGSFDSKGDRSLVFHFLFRQRCLNFVVATAF